MMNSFSEYVTRNRFSLDCDSEWSSEEEQKIYKYFHEHGRPFTIDPWYFFKEDGLVCARRTYWWNGPPFNAPDVSDVLVQIEQHYIKAERIE